MNEPHELAQSPSSVLAKADDLNANGHHAEALALLRAHPAMDAARADLQRVVDDARSVLAPLPSGPVRSALEALCDSLATRTT